MYYQYFSGSKRVFAQGHNTALVGIEPRPPALELGALPLGHHAAPEGNEDHSFALSFLIGSSSFLQVRRTAIRAWMSSNFRQIHSRLLAALERLKYLHRISIIFGRTVVTTLAPSIFNGSSFNLQFTRTTIQA